MLEARGGGENVDQRVAEKDSADHLFRPRQHLVDEGCRHIAVFLKRVHARSRSGRQRRLAGIEERRQNNQQKDCGEAYDYGHG